MRTRTVVSICRSIPVAALALALIQPASAADDTLKVKVLPDRYLSAGLSFKDVATLAAWSGRSPVRSLSLETCGPASTRQLLAAVERLQSAYPDGINIRTLRAGERDCLTSDSGYLAVDGSGRSLLP